jgi:hypothetical protein
METTIVPVTGTCTIWGSGLSGDKLMLDTEKIANRSNSQKFI